MMALLALQEDYANGRIRRKRDFRDHDDDWLICRFKVPDIAVIVIVI